MLRPAGLALATTLAAGCLDHERPPPEDAGTDARVVIDAHVVDAGHDAPAIDAPAIDAASCDNDGTLFRTLCNFDLPLADVVATSCTSSGSSCLQLDVYGRDSFDDPAAICSSARWMDQGTRFIFHRCAPGSERTTVRVTVLDSPPASAGVFTLDPSGCGCVAATSGMSAGDTFEVDGTASPDQGFDAFSFFGAGTHYHVEVCALGSCP